MKSFSLSISQGVFSPFGGLNILEHKFTLFDTRIIFGKEKALCLACLFSLFISRGEWRRRGDLHDNVYLQCLHFGDSPVLFGVARGVLWQGSW
jgi:hypothetical protein